MKLKEIILAVFGCVWHWAYWTRLSAKVRFTRRNQLVQGSVWK